MHLARGLLLIGGLVVIIVGGVLMGLGHYRHVPEVERVGTILVVAGFIDLLLCRWLLSRGGRSGSG
jgi:hypothetical protein